MIGLGDDVVKKLLEGLEAWSWEKKLAETKD